MVTRKTYELASFKTLDDSEGKFEAVVSVFGNIDHQGDRVMPGAFKKSLAAWRKSGDPIPVIWSHDWLNPDAHVGWVDPNDAEEILTDQKSDGGIKGGLLVRGQFDVHKPFAGQVFDLLKSRRVKSWSFAYDVNDEQKATDGANDLNELAILEVGPCLVGANERTFTVSAKSVTEAELEEAYEAERSLTRHLDMLKSLDDPALETVGRVLSKTALEGEAKNERKKAVDMTLAELEAASKGEELPIQEPVEEKVATKPWHVEKRGDQWCVIKDSDNSTVSCHDSEDDANAHVRALYANESSDDPEGAKSEDEVVEENEKQSTSTSTSTTTANVIWSNLPVPPAPQIVIDETAAQLIAEAVAKALKGAPEARDDETRETEPDGEKQETPTEYLTRLLGEGV